MKRSELGSLTCSLAGALAEVGDAWSLMIVKELMLKNRRFDGIAAQTGMSESSLTARLKSMEAAGLISRHAYQERPPRSEYRLTERGADLWPILVALTGWGDRWLGRESRPLVYACRACGEASDPVLTCACCAAPLQPRSVTAVLSEKMTKERDQRHLTQ